MSIRIMLTEGKYNPIIECDNCGKRIDDFRHGNVVFSRPQNGTPNTILFLHKDCDNKEFWNTQDEQGLPWFELGQFLLHLEGNVGLTDESRNEVQATLKRLDDMGL